MNQVSRVLRVARALTGVSRYAMADRIGLSRTYYRDLEAGDVAPGAHALRKIARVTGMSVEAVVVMGMEEIRELDKECAEMLRQVQDHLMREFVTRVNR